MPEFDGLATELLAHIAFYLGPLPSQDRNVAYCCEELLKSGPAAVAVAVVHNKDKPKRGTIPEGVDYFAGATVPDLWNCYPWDSAAYGLSIREHEARATAREQMPISMRSEK